VWLAGTSAVCEECGTNNLLTTPTTTTTTMVALDIYLPTNSISVAKRMGGGGRMCIFF
jgi:hypothetical protein